MIKAAAKSVLPPISSLGARAWSAFLHRKLVLYLAKFRQGRGDFIFPVTPGLFDGSYPPLLVAKLLQRPSSTFVGRHCLALGIFLFCITWPLVGLLAAEESLEGDGLVAHWKFKEGSGSVVKDYSGNGNNGTILPANAPAPKWGSGEFKGSIAFGSGVAHHVLIPASHSLNNLKRQITVIAHIYPRSLWAPPSIVQRIWRKAIRVATEPLGLAATNKNTGYIALVQRQWRETVHPDLFYLGYGPENNVLHYKWHLGLLGAEPSLYRLPEGQSKPVVGEWVHLAGTYNAETGRMSLYVNGKPIGTETHVGEIRLDPESLNRPLIIGGELNGSNIGEIDSEFNGYVDDVRLYDRALSDTQIDALALEAWKARN